MTTNIASSVSHHLNLAPNQASLCCPGCYGLPFAAQTARLAGHRSATLISGSLTPDGELDLEQQPACGQQHPTAPGSGSGSEPPQGNPGHQFKVDGAGARHLSGAHQGVAVSSGTWDGFQAGGLSQSAPAPGWRGGSGRWPRYGSSSGGGGGSARVNQSTVVILPRMMNVYASVLGGVKVGPMSRRPPRNANRYPRYQNEVIQKQTWVVPTKSEEAQVLAHGAANIVTVLGTADLAPEASTNSLRSQVSSSWRKGVGSHSRHLGRQRSVAIDDSDSESGGRDSRLRMIAVKRDDEPTLPLDCDQTAPALGGGQKLSSPTLHDIDYLLNRWAWLPCINASFSTCVDTSFSTWQLLPISMSTCCTPT